MKLMFIYCKSYILQWAATKANESGTRRGGSSAVSRSAQAGVSCGVHAEIGVKSRMTLRPSYNRCVMLHVSLCGLRLAMQTTPWAGRISPPRHPPHEPQPCVRSNDPPPAGSMREECSHARTVGWLAKHKVVVGATESWEPPPPQPLGGGGRVLEYTHCAKCSHEYQNFFFILLACCAGLPLFLSTTAFVATLS